MKKKKFDDEIDLSDLILSLWKNKFKVLVITTAFILIGFFYFNFLNKSFLASTTIKPVSTFESQKYKLYNSLAGETSLTEKTSLAEKTSLSKEISMKIDSEKLLSLFINKIQTTEIVQEAINKSNLINKDDYTTKEIYNEAVKRIALLIINQVSSPTEDKKINQPYWKFNYNVNNKLNWRSFLEYLEKKANEEIRESLIAQFNTNLDILNNHFKFRLEDIDQDIANEIDDYKTSISKKLTFLNEQAEIARTLNIAKNTLGTENFQMNNTIVTNIKSEDSYYLKGYEMIEKEISLIKSRKDEKAFIENLIELEKEKRAILQNKKIERLKVLFSQTPVYNKNKFVAAKIDYLTTSYKPNQSLVRIILISLIIGLLMSFITIAINNIISSRK
jgi:LPS O-antigen subunit length determinant protein (WzzB/FepE family)